MRRHSDKTWKDTFSDEDILDTGMTFVVLPLKNIINDFKLKLKSP